MLLLALVLCAPSLADRTIHLPWSPGIIAYGTKEGGSLWAQLAGRGAVGCVNTKVAGGFVAEALDLRSATALVREFTGPGRLTVVMDQPPPGHLGFVGIIGEGIPARTVLTSPTTRTRGLIALTDLTPEGRTPTFLPAEDPFSEVRRFERAVAWLEEGKLAILGAFAALAFGTVLLSLASLRRARLRETARFALRLATLGTLSLFAVLPFTNYSGIVLGIVYLVATCALAMPLVRWRNAVPWLLRGLIFVVALDSVFHFGLVALSPLSGYYLSGIRYYGIGNEYMGLLLGAYLMAIPPRLRLPVGVALVLLLGLPMLGANAGGAMAATVGVVAIAGKGRWQSRGALGVLAALAVAVGLALFDRMQPGAAQSHIGQAAGQGPAGWGAIIVRKLAMNLRLGVAAPTLAAIVGLAPVWWWMAKAKGGAPIRDAVAADPDLRRRLVAALLAAAAAIAFNDSGIVAAILLLAPVTVTLLDRALSPDPAVQDPIDGELAEIRPGDP